MRRICTPPLTSRKARSTSETLARGRLCVLSHDSVDVAVRAGSGQRMRAKKIQDRLRRVDVGAGLPQRRNGQAAWPSMTTSVDRAEADFRTAEARGPSH